MLTKFNSNQNFNGYIRISAPKENAYDLKKNLGPNDVTITKQEFNYNGKIDEERVPSVTINTDSILSVTEDITNAAGPRSFLPAATDLRFKNIENTIICLSDKTKYILRNIKKEDFDNSLLEASASKTNIVDIVG